MEPDYEWAKSVLAERRVLSACPMCGHNQWRQPGDLANLVAAVPIATPFGEVVRGPDGERAAAVAYLFACANCGFIRLHDARVLEEPPPPG